MNPQDGTTIAVAEDTNSLSETVIPKILKDSAGGESCCIFRIPECLVQIHKACEPKIVSIGPYHHGNDRFKMIQEHKHRYLKFFISKTQEKGVGLQDLIDTVSRLENDIRDSYSENLGEKFDQQKLINLMVLDGCFILTLFFVVANIVRYTKFDDPIFRMRWILPSIQSDLLLLENQVPLCLLQALLKTSKLAPSKGLNEIAFEFFRYSIKQRKEVWAKHHNLQAKHLLDLIRKTFIPTPYDQTRKQSCLRIGCCSEGLESVTEPPRQSCLTIHCCSKAPSKAETPGPSPFLKLVVSAKKLRLRGIKFKPRENADTILDIRLENGVLWIPPLTFDDSISSVFRNCIAFEQFNKKCSTEITSYVVFMGCLLDTEADATFLSEKGIIENYFGTGEQVSVFFKNLGEGVIFNLAKSYLSKVFEGVNEYTSKGAHVQWAGFRYTYFGSPWTFLSSCAALTLLALTIFQAFFAAYAYFRPPQGN